MKGLICNNNLKKIKEKKSHLSLSFSLLFLLGSFTLSLVLCLSNSKPVSAAQADYEYFGVYRSYYNNVSQCQSPGSYIENIGYDSPLTVCNVYSVLFQSSPVQFKGNNLTVSAKINLVARLGANGTADEFGYYDNLNSMELRGISLKDSNNNIYTFNPESVSYQYYVTPWFKGNYRYQTLTIILTATGRASTTLDGQYRARVLFGHDESSSYPLLKMELGTSNPNRMPPQIYFEKTDTAVTINGTSSVSDSLLQAQIDQNSTMINQNQTIIENQQATTDAINEQNERDQEDRDNLEQQAQDGQDAAEDAGAEAEAQGQSFIQIISSFINGLANLSASDCMIDVDLTLYQGGSHNSVNICSGKNSSVANILNIIGGVVISVVILRMSISVIHAIQSLYKEYQQ